MSMSRGPCGPAVELRKIAWRETQYHIYLLCPSYRGCSPALAHMRVVGSRRKCRCKAHTVQPRIESPCTNHEDCDSAARSRAL